VHTEEVGWRPSRHLPKPFPGGPPCYGSAPARSGNSRSPFSFRQLPVSAGASRREANRRHLDWRGDIRPRHLGRIDNTVECLLVDEPELQGGRFERGCERRGVVVLDRLEPATRVSERRDNTAALGERVRHIERLVVDGDGLADPTASVVGRQTPALAKTQVIAMSKGTLPLSLASQKPRSTM
jgi:hypothetical protein